MLVQNLSITYKCYSSIGNSLDLEKMMYQALRTFVSETHAIYALYANKENDMYKEIASFGKIDFFDPMEYEEYSDEINNVKDENNIVLIIRLNHGSIFLITKNLDADCTFFISMFESFLVKLNLSIQSCLNVQKMKETNELLEKQKNELKIANKAKDEFLANMSHELKTPLNSINVISSVMKKNKDDSLSEKQVKNLEVIYKCGLFLQDMINDVLDISKLESGNIIADYSMISLSHLIEEIHDVFLPQITEKGLNLKLLINLDNDQIYNDKVKIKQILKNFLSNALKFTNEGNIELDVHDDEKNIYIFVKDDGIGIEEDKLSYIFDRFKQADSSTTKRYGGTGLGLAISKELAELLNGNIEVESQINKGSTFKVILPKNLDKIPS